jgi:hypothetical protein
METAVKPVQTGRGLRIVQVRRGGFLGSPLL